jgi:hypothetical protein
MNGYLLGISSARDSRHYRTALAAPWLRNMRNTTMTTNYATDTEAEREAEFVRLLCLVPADEREEVFAMLATVAGPVPIA